MNTYFTLAIVISVAAGMLIAWGLMSLVAYLRCEKRELKEPFKPHERKQGLTRKLKEM